MTKQVQLTLLTDAGRHLRVLTTVGGYSATMTEFSTTQHQIVARQVPAIFATFPTELQQVLTTIVQASHAAL